jgi:hypothetical protein
MSLQKYKFVGADKKGLRHHLGNLGLVVLNGNVTDEIAEAAIKAGLPYYELAESEAAVKTETSTEALGNEVVISKTNNKDAAKKGQNRTKAAGAEAGGTDAEGAGSATAEPEGA